MLAYLFRAVYPDGVFEQPADDLSAKYPGRSAFADVERDRLLLFHLIGTQEIPGAQYGVDLTTGDFIVNGCRFKMHEGELYGFRLIFFRRHTHTFCAGSLAELSHEVVYRLGWQATDGEGKNVQRVMEIR